MKNFAHATPDRDYETYCPQCKRRDPLSWKDMEWLQVMQRIGQHPHYRCGVCPVGEYGIRQRMQVRLVRGTAQKRQEASR
jgi:hypothetical protein